jgi:hypothetical protein
MAVPCRVRTIRVRGDIRLTTWIFAKILGKKRYDVAIVEKNIEMNESSLKLLDIMPIRSATERKKRITGISGRTIKGDAFIQSVSNAEIPTIPTK